MGETALSVARGILGRVGTALGMSGSDPGIAGAAPVWQELFDLLQKDITAVPDWQEGNIILA